MDKCPAIRIERDADKKTKRRTETQTNSQTWI